jgi:endonuclease YncB( thermonuclease family)
VQRRRIHRYIIRTTPVLALFITGVVLLMQHYGWLQKAATGSEQSQPGTYAIDHFIDGDTIAVNMNGTVEKIRMIGVDTPETHKPNTPVQCYGEAAAAYTKQLIGNGRVRLASDSQSSNRDRYNRLLRYVYVPDGRMIETELITNGYGFAYTYFPFSKSAEFTADEQQAQAAHKGLWSVCKPTPNQYGGYTSNVVGSG